MPNPADEVPLAEEPGPAELRHLRDELHGAVAAVATPPDLLARAKQRAADQRRRRQRLLVTGTALAAAAVVLAVLALVPARHDESVTATAPPANAITAFDYKFLAPSDWVRTGGSVPERKVVVRPADRQDGDDLVVVQEFPMTYDATADRARLAEELRSSAAQAGPQYSGFDSEARFAGKTVMYYHEAKPAAAVDWYVDVKGTVRVHVGCQYAGAVPRDRVAGACEQVVRTLEIVR